MNWFETYNLKLLNYDLLLRNPLGFKEKVNKIFDLKGMTAVNLGVSFSKTKENDNLLIALKSMLDTFSGKSKVATTLAKAGFGKKAVRLSVKLNKVRSFIFLDFFLNIMLKGLKRRYISLRYGTNTEGMFNFRFASMYELELDDYFFFELFDWKGVLNVFFNYSMSPEISSMYNLLFLNLFKLKSFSKYEIFTSKG
jgi:hypothetical protein